MKSETTESTSASPRLADGAKAEELQWNNSSPASPPAWQVLAAFAAIYVVWGSTYLGIRYAIQTIPPFLMAGSRFMTAGLLFFTVARWRGARLPSLREWRDAAIAGSLMLTVGNGGVTWAEQVIPSGVAALLVALIPVWMVLFDWLRPHGVRPAPLVFAGLAIGFAGVVVLARGHDGGGGTAHVWGVVALIVASICWAIGSLFNRQARKPKSALLGIALQFITGGACLFVLALLRGEPAEFSIARLTWVSVGAWAYLTLIGAGVGYSAYVWLLQVSTPARVSTYAYVNPLIAVLLGCTIAGEAFSHELLVAGAMIILAVVLIVRSGSRRASIPREVSSVMKSAN